MKKLVNFFLNIIQSDTKKLLNIDRKIETLGRNKHGHEAENALHKQIEQEKQAVILEHETQLSKVDVDGFRNERIRLTTKRHELHEQREDIIKKLARGYVEDLRKTEADIEDNSDDINKLEKAVENAETQLKMLAYEKDKEIFKIDYKLKFIIKQSYSIHMNGDKEQSEGSSSSGSSGSSEGDTLE